MLRQLFALAMGIAMLLGGEAAWASGAAYRLSGYAVAGANPRVVLVVTDNQGNGVQGVPVTITSTAGVLDVIAGTTAADGTLTVTHSGGSLGDQITAASTGLAGSPLVLTSAAAQTVKSSDTVIAWYDESRRLANAVVVTAGLGVLTSNSLFNFTATDFSSDSRPLALGQSANLTQTASAPAQTEVMQGTYNSGDRINVNETTVTGSPDAYLYFSNVQPSRMFFAYATGGANPSVCAVVTDSRGVAVEGVTVTAACSAGSLDATTAYTSVEGVCFFQQTGGSLGDTLMISCPTLAQTSAVTMTTAASPAIAASNKVFAWFTRKSRKVFTAMVDRVTHVLVTPGAADHVQQNFVNISGGLSGPEGQSGGAFLDQTAYQPAVTGSMAFGISEAGDLVRIYQDTAIYRYSTYHAILELPANETRYLLAFASGGSNPTAWAVVTNSTGNAVPGVSVNFTMQGSGSLSQSNTVTGWAGYAWSVVSGASATGNTITVSSPGLGTVRIYTADSQSPMTTDRTYAWYVPGTHQIYAAPVNFANNVMHADGTAIGVGYMTRRTANNYPYFSSFTSVASPWPCMGHVGFGTMESGDYIRFTQGVTAIGYEAYITADPDPAKFLVAFAKGGVDPLVWAVVMDNKCNALEGEPVSFSTSQGSMSLGNTVTGWGGMVQAQHTSGLLGNTLTVNAPGLPPAVIYTADPVNLGAGDPSAVWYDASRQVVWGINFTHHNRIVTTNASYATSLVYDNTPANNRNFSVNEPVGHNMSSPARTACPLALWAIAPGSAGVGDEIRLAHYTYYSFIRIASVRASYLRAYAVSGTDPSLVRAMLVTHEGVGIPNVNVHFTCGGSATMSGGPSWVTGMDGTVDSGQTGGVVNDVITVSSSGYPPVMIVTNNSGGVTGSSVTHAWYSPGNRKLSTAVIQYPCYNVTVSGVTPSVSFVPADNTSNHKTVAISGAKEDALQQPTYGYVAEGTSGAGDAIRVQTLTAAAPDDATVLLPADESRYLWAFAAGGANPKVWAVVTDGHGNGLAGVPVRIVYPGPNTVNLATDASGITTNARTGVNLGDTLYITADGLSNTVTVKVSNATNVDPTTRTIGWYDVLNWTGYAAFVNLPTHILALGTSAVFSALDTTPNGLAFAVGSATQQTTSAPAFCPIVNGTQGQGDIISVSEGTALAEPDLQLSIHVPNASLVSSLLAGPVPTLTGQYFGVTMTVFNNGSPTALSVTPSNLTVAGAATLVSGPDPSQIYSLPGGESTLFYWTYQANVPGSVTITGQAFAVDAYTYQGLTATVASANLVTVRDPHPPVLTPALTAWPGLRSAGQTVNITLSVTNDSDSDVPQALTVTPSAVSVAGPATYQSGPVPASQLVPRGESRDFTWVYATTEAGHVTFTAQAYTLDPFNYSGITSTAAVSNLLTVQAPAALSASLFGPDNAERLRDFTLTMRVTNLGAATAVSVTPEPLSLTGTSWATYVSGPEPALAEIPGGGSQTFTWTYHAADTNGTLQASGQARGYDANSAGQVTTSTVTSNPIFVIQGALNLDRVSTAATVVYRGQAGIPVSLEARNTSLMPVTLTAATLNFNGTVDGFMVIPAPGNPMVIPAQTSFVLQFLVNVSKSAGLGSTILNGSIAGESQTGAMAANGSQQTATWLVQEAFNQLRQNYPNPLRLSQNAFTTLDYFLQEDVPTTLKLYNLAGELVAVLVDGSPGVGRHTVQWYGDNGDLGQRGKTVGSGVYLAVLKSGAYQEIKKVVVIR